MAVRRPALVIAALLLSAHGERRFLAALRAGSIVDASLAHAWGWIRGLSEASKNSRVLQHLAAFLARLLLSLSARINASTLAKQ